MADSGINTLRRFYLLKRITAKQLDELALSSVWHSKQEEQPGGVTLPVGFPKKTELEAVGYVAKNDFIPGADSDELIQYAGLTRREADAVIAAAAAL